MVSAVRQRLRGPLAIVLIIFGSVIATACSSDITVPVPESSEPLLYLVIGDAVENVSASQPDTVLYALLATVGTPINSPPRSASRFELRDIETGNIYSWREITGTDPLRSGMDLVDGVSQVANYVLPWSSTPSGLGAGDLVYGRTYSLYVETGGVEIRGITTLPARFDVITEEAGGQRVVSWPRVRGAAAYFVGFNHPGNIFGGISHTTVDTSFAIPAGFGTGDSVLVEARDANYVLAREDQGAGTRRGRAGIDTGYGVFAAVTRARTVLP